MKLLITGSRSLQERRDDLLIFMKHTLDNFFESYPDGVIYDGGAEGPDTWAHQYCQWKGKKDIQIYPDYRHLGKNAPLIRDKQLVDEVDMIYAFWDCESTGTAYTFNYALDSGKPVSIFKFPKAD